MNFLKLLSLTLICCTFSAISPSNATTWKSSTNIEKEESKREILDLRFEQLTQGINVSHWLAQTDYFNFNYITKKDLQTIKSSGFKHIRLPIDPIILLDEHNPKILNTKYLDYLDTALDMIQAHDLSVIIALKPKDEFKERLATEDGFVDTVVKFWKTLATHLSPRNPEQVFLETINEPAFNYFLRNDPDTDPVKRWDEVQGKLLAAMREGAPNHTLIAKGHTWDGIDDLLALTPVEDSNVVYNFHFYDPMLFTHQGADWVSEGFAELQGLPYPFNEQKCTVAIEAIQNEKAKGFAESYCYEKWDKAKMETKIAKAANWAKQHNVLLTANEFGVYRPFVDREDLLTWMFDVRSLLEQYNIGWSMWEYSKGFGLVREQEPGIRVVHEDVRKALGLYQYEQPTHRKIPEPSAIAGLLVVTFVGIGAKRRS